MTPKERTDRLAELLHTLWGGRAESNVILARKLVEAGVVFTDEYKARPSE